MRTIITSAIAVIIITMMAFQPAHSQSKVTFQVNLAHEIERGTFNPEEHRVELSGNVYPLSMTRFIELTPSEDDSTLYLAEIEFPMNTVNRDVNYRFRLNLGGRFVNEDLPRAMRVPNRDARLSALYFNSYAW